ncbi:hypothetical protein Daura_38295 [Dactylosporangium aurantiacum]|uniref:Uncharacterized protein n=1 Tax=Dactylosporangium aurantiacum TaxID=35754 RepID=A0A9Q9IDQ1_9ACTN|nr:hypothetical protein [Dactylosporangium aurantiacum]MDG6101728.1 hypothetical protein [Dactylosporangium aurantiacum]UWZ52460.1 hypothetical protein Daura_38295 [Dactylosporangium aurantiacum]
MGTLVLLDPARVLGGIVGERAAPQVRASFAYDEGFLQLRGPVLLALLVTGIGVQAALVWHGRWGTRLHHVDTVHTLLTCAGLTWVLGAGPVFTAAATDQTAKGFTGLIVLVSLVDLAVRARRHHVRRALHR